MSTKENKFMTIVLEKGIDLYLSTLATEGKSPRYIGWLKDRLRYFTTFIHKEHGDIFLLQDLDLEHGRNYLRELMARETKFATHPVTATVSGKLAIQYIHGCGRAVRSFCTWAAEEGYLAENVMQRLKLPKLPTTLPEPLNEEQIRLVLSISLNHTLERLRNYSILMLFLDTGLRLSELMHLQLSKIDFPLGEMTIMGKGSKERKVPIGSQAKKALVDYLSRERPDPANPNDEDRVYLTAEGRPVSQDTIEKLFQRVKQAAGLSKFHPHICRHTFAVRYLINCGDVFSLQKILGHSSLEMTRKYVNLASGDVKDKHRRFSPMDNLNFQGRRPGRPSARGMTNSSSNQTRKGW